MTLINQLCRHTVKKPFNKQFYFVLMFNMNANRALLKSNYFCIWYLNSSFHNTSANYKQKMRKESDFFGELEIPADKLYGVQTCRALLNFPIGSDAIEKLPFALMRGMIISKKVSALVNKDYGLDAKIADAISQAADEVLSGKIGKEHFPCIIWTSHTAPNMNANEVLSNRAIQILGGVVGSKKPVHPNDHCNMGQSSNDTFPTAMHIAVAEEIHHNLLPSLECLRDTLGSKCQEFAHIIKTGRTHIQDAIPLTLGQEFSGYCTAINFGIDRIKDTLPRLYMLALGGTAVGTGYTAFDGYDEKCAAKIAEITKLPFVTAPNKFEPIAAHDTMVEVHGALNTVSCSLIKMANDFRLMSSGPRCGLGEISLPANEPGSSIMPGKVNPTQCEAVTMVAAQIIGTHVSVSIGSFIGQLELNVFKAIIGTNVYRSVRILADVVSCFTKNCVVGITANEDNIKNKLNESLMLVTALLHTVGYEKSAAIAKLAKAEGIKLKEAAAKLGISEKQYDEIVRPEDMLVPEVYKKKDKKTEKKK